MNAALGDLLFKLIGSFAGDQSAQKNPYLGQQPGDVDPSFKGDPTDLVNQPYVTPSWATRFFHPDVANEETQKNLAGYNALIDNAAKTGVARKNLGDVIPVIGMDPKSAFATNPSGAAHYYPNPSAEGVESGLTSAADTANSIPALGSLGRLGAAQDVIRKGAARLLTGSPEKEVAAGNAQSDYTTSLLPSSLQYQLGKNAADLSLLPSEVFARGYGNIATGEDARRTVTGSPKLDALFAQGLDTRLSKGTVEQALAKDQEENIPVLAATQHAERRGRLWAATHPESPLSPFFTNLDTGRPEFNAAYPSMIRTMYAKMGQTDTGTANLEAGIPFSGGKILTNPSSTGPAITPTVDTSPSRASLMSGKKTIGQSTILPTEKPKAVMPKGLSYDEQVEWMKKHPKEAASQPIDDLIETLGKWFKTTPLGAPKDKWGAPLYLNPKN